MKNNFKSFFVILTLICIFTFIAGCKDSSIDDSGDSAVSASAGSTSTPSTPAVSTAKEDQVSGRQAIAETTAKPTLSEATISKDLSGSISIDGSALMSTISDKIAEQFRKACPKMTIKTGLSGTEEGIAKYISKQIDICNTSRPLTDNEASEAKAQGADFVELKVAYDGVVIVVNKSSTVDSITLNEIKAIWNPDSTIMNWKEVNPKWPDNDLMVFGPKADTGLIDFFTANVLKTSDNQIGVYTEVNSDKELAKSIAGDNTAIGLTNFSNYFNSKSSLKALKIDFGSGPVVADIENIKNGKYQQFSSPMYLYVSKTSLQKAEVKAFIKYYLENAPKIVTEAGYVPLSDKDYAAQLSAIQ